MSGNADLRAGQGGGRAVHSRRPTEEFPDEPTDPAEVALWYTAPQWRWLRFNILDSSRPVGFAIGSHFEWSEAPDRLAEVEVGLLPDLRTSTRTWATATSMTG